MKVLLFMLPSKLERSCTFEEWKSAYFEKKKKVKKRITDVTIKGLYS